ncbi:response regulator [Paenibacillaceae bacterium]|nr:response regulator [Paenibacillaceae bacterium]
MMSTYTVFVADDERMAREGIADRIAWDALGLTLAGTAPDGRIAYQQIVRLQPDIVITDIKMPLMSGLELIRLTQQVLPGTVFIVLSGYGEFELAAQAMKYGVRHYLLKPSNEEEITEALQAAMEELDVLQAHERQLQGMQQAGGDAVFYAACGSSDNEGSLHKAADSSQSLQLATGGMETKIAAAIIAGDLMVLQETLDGFFQTLFEVRAEAKVAIGRCMAFMESVHKKLQPLPDAESKEASLQIWQLKTLQDIHHYMLNELTELLNSRKELRTDKKALLIARIKQLTGSHLADRQLSLQWLAQHHLFLNSEYLGKLFRLEAGEKYTQYLTRLRMEMAKELLETHPSLKIYEIAEKCGFDQDPQYFANVFKKAYGYTPGEYRKQLANRIL